MSSSYSSVGLSNTLTGI